MIRTIALWTSIVLGTLTAVLVVVVTVLYLVNAGDYSVPATTADDPSLPYIDIEGYRFHGETVGDPGDPTVIVLHGGPGGDYRSLLPLRDLADQYFVVFYDQRGTGLSPRVGEEQLTVERYVADLELLIDRFSTDDPALLIGHSWGAMLASTYIGRRPETIAAAVLAEPGFLDHAGMEYFKETTGLSGTSPSWSVMAAMSKYWAESLHIDGPDEHARRDYLMGAFFSAPIENHPLGGYYPENDVRNAAGEFWRFGALASQAVYQSGLDPEGRLIDLAAGVERFSGPVLFLSGSENSIIGEERQRIHMRRFQNADLTVIPDAGHTMIGEKPKESVAVIRRFFNERQH